MAKSAAHQKQEAKVQESKEPVLNSKPAPVQDTVDKFLNDLASLTYYDIHGSRVLFKDLPDAEQAVWMDTARSMVESLGKMNKKIVNYEEPAEIEANRNRNINRLTEIIQDFISGLKIIKCQKCGGNGEIRRGIFPSHELAHRIWGSKATP